MYFLKALMSGWFLYVRMTLKVGCGIFSDDAEAATRGILREMVFLEISQNSQENTCPRVSFLIKLQASWLQLY